MKARTIACTLVMTGLVLPLGAGERLAIRVSPLMGLAPAYVRVQATVERAAANRRMEIIAESEDFYRSSEIDLEGDRAPRTTYIEFRSLPGGEYTVHATLRGVGGETLASVERQIRIVGTGDRR